MEQQQQTKLADSADFMAHIQTEKTHKNVQYKNTVKNLNIGTCMSEQTV